jgi:hypothetical protein
MKEGDIVLALLPQTDGRGKYRPAVVLRKMAGLGDLLACGINVFFPGFPSICSRKIKSDAGI